MYNLPPRASVWRRLLSCPREAKTRDGDRREWLITKNLARVKNTNIMLIVTKLTRKPESCPTSSGKIKDTISVSLLTSFVMALMIYLSSQAIKKEWKNKISPSGNLKRMGLVFDSNKTFPIRAEPTVFIFIHRFLIM